MALHSSSMKHCENRSSAPLPPTPTLPSHLAADRAVLRSTLREEARKAVGDTGLLDHLLKHLVRVGASSSNTCVCMCLFV